MKRDKVKELRSKSAEELEAIAADLKEKLEKLNFDLKSGKTASIKDIRRIRKEIAVTLTVINEKKHD
jgi:ribosomal protein L29